MEVFDQETNEAIALQASEESRLATIAQLGQRALRATVSTIKAVPHNKMRTLESAVVAVEANPFISDAGRYSLLFATLAATGDPIYAASAYAISTLGIEAAGAYSAADLITTEKGAEVTSKLGRLLDKTPLKHLLHNGEKPPIVVEGLILSYLGTSAQVFAHKKTMPDMTRAQLQRRGFYGAGFNTGLTFAEGELIAEGVRYITDPNISVPTGVAFAGVLIAQNMLKNRKLRRSENPNVRN